MVRNLFTLHSSSVVATALETPKMAMTKEEVEAYLSTTDVRTPLETALNAIVASKAPKAGSFFANYFVAASEYEKLGCAKPCPHQSGVDWCVRALAGSHFIV